MYRTSIKSIFFFLALDSDQNEFLMVNSWGIFSIFYFRYFFFQLLYRYKTITSPEGNIENDEDKFFFLRGKRKHLQYRLCWNIHNKLRTQKNVLYLKRCVILLSWIMEKCGSCYYRMLDLYFYYILINYKIFWGLLTESREVYFEIMQSFNLRKHWLLS